MKHPGCQKADLSRRRIIGKAATVAQGSSFNQQQETACEAENAAAPKSLVGNASDERNRRARHGEVSVRSAFASSLNSGSLGHRSGGRSSGRSGSGG